jgi:hypothetical protein
MPSKNPMIAVRLDPDLYAGVQELAAKEGRSVANWVRRYVMLLVEDGHAETTYLRADHQRRCNPGETHLEVYPEPRPAALPDVRPSSRPGEFQTHVRNELSRPGLPRTPTKPK